MGLVDYKLDPKKTTTEQRDKIDIWKTNQEKLTALNDIADISQDISTTLDTWKKEGSKNTDKLGALLTDVRTSLSTLAGKKDPEAPDYAKPVVKAVEELKTALQTAIKAIDVKPDVNLPAPVINTESVDLSKLEKILRTDIPNAFKESIKLIPEVDIPESDYTPLTNLMTEISEKLDSIDTGVRMKPSGVNAKIINPSDITAGLATEGKQDDIIAALGGGVKKTLIDKTTTPNVIYIGKAPIGTALGTGAWQIKKIDKTVTDNVTITFAAAGAFTATWNNRGSETYS